MLSSARPEVRRMAGRGIRLRARRREAHEGLGAPTALCLGKSWMKKDKGVGCSGRFAEERVHRSATRPRREDPGGGILPWRHDEGARHAAGHCEAGAIYSTLMVSSGWDVRAETRRRRARRDWLQYDREPADHRASRPRNGWSSIATSATPTRGSHPELVGTDVGGRGLALLPYEDCHARHRRLGDADRRAGRRSICGATGDAADSAAGLPRAIRRCRSTQIRPFAVDVVTTASCRTPAITGRRKMTSSTCSPSRYRKRRRRGVAGASCSTCTAA